MSFILDALKKSETERQRQNVPGLMDMGPTTARARFPVWGLLLGVLLAINLVVLAIVLLRKTPAPVPISAPPPMTSAPAPQSTHFSPMDVAPVYAPEIVVAPAAISRPAPISRKTIAPAPVVRAEPRLTPADGDEVLPTLDEINLAGKRGFPDLHLDIHVYSAKPAERFVFINNRRYREGAAIDEGPMVERITPDGVNLRYNGMRFSLPRQH